MDSQTKVMTVSYGTFSCTLEGFDDPFSTMQHVAEYFRELAANDRYFGGDPLQPDASTLHQIARDTNPNKVDAEVSDNSVILRQADVVDAPAVAPAVTPPKATQAPKPRPEFASRRRKPVARKKPLADETLVEPTIFSSRRNALEPAAEEPQKPAAQMLAEEDPRLRTIKAPENVGKKPAAVTPKKPKVQVQAAPVAKPAPRRQDLHQDNDILHEEEALERLLETTNSKLSTPSHARRSNALERLKAAVAATEAERRVRGKSKTNRPNVHNISAVHGEDTKIPHPVTRKADSRRRSNIATLILGSDQRIPHSETPDSGLKKNSRVEQIKRPTLKRPNLEIVSPTQTLNPTVGFDAFAQKSGANTLQELLEASAAYLAIVEDQSRFSQERLISHVDNYLQDNSITPEATNRSLNRLLRDGRILRIQADRFCISKSTRNGYQEKIAG